MTAPSTALPSLPGAASFQTADAFASWALECPVETLVEFLRKEPHWARASNKEGDTVLMRAAASGDFARLKVLLPLSDVHARNVRGRSALVRAAARGDIDCLQLLLDHCEPQHCHQLDEDAESALFWAVEMQHSNACVQLLLNGADLSQQSRLDLRSGQTVLMIAAGKNNPRLVEFLLPHCSPKVIQLQDAMGRSALAHAITEPGESSVALLAPHSEMSQESVSTWGERRTPLMLAVSRGSPKSILAVLPHCSPAVCHQQDEEGLDALMLAIIKKPPQTQALVPHSNLSNQSKTGQTALMYAAASPDHGTTMACIVRHSTPEQLVMKDSRGKDAFDWSMDSGNAEGVDCLSRILNEQQAQRAVRRFGAEAVPQTQAVLERMQLQASLGNQKKDPNTQSANATKEINSTNTTKATFSGPANAPGGLSLGVRVEKRTLAPSQQPLKRQRNRL